MDPQEAAPSDADSLKAIIAKDWEQTGTTDFGQASALELGPIIDNIAGKLERLNLVTTDNMENIKDNIRSSLNKLKGYLNDSVVAEILALISKMEIKIVEQQVKQMYGPSKLVYKLMFELHDTIGLYWRDSSTERCNGIHVFQSLIKALILYINNNKTHFTYKFKKYDAGLDVTSDHAETITAADISVGEGLQKSVSACSNKARLVKNVSPSEGHTAVSAGGSKSRRRHRRRVRKTSRGRGRTRKSKSKSKTKPRTHRRRRHSRIRKHKKNTYTRRK